MSISWNPYFLDLSFFSHHITHCWADAHTKHSTAGRYNNWSTLPCHIVPPISQAPRLHYVPSPPLTPLPGPCVPLCRCLPLPPLPPNLLSTSAPATCSQQQLRLPGNNNNNSTIHTILQTTTAEYELMNHIPVQWVLVWQYWESERYKYSGKQQCSYVWNFVRIGNILAEEFTSFLKLYICIYDMLQSSLQVYRDYRTKFNPNTLHIYSNTVTSVFLLSQRSHP